MKQKYATLAFCVFSLTLVFVGVAVPVEAATKVKTPVLEVSGWMPYWRKASSTADMAAHLNEFSEINPFGYTLKEDGTLYDAMKIDEEPWASLLKSAKAKKIRVIPTVMWGNGEAIHATLSNAKSRIALEDQIAALVKAKGFDGIEIDFEGKKAETKEYFSTFLKGLYQRMGNKWVMCDIEARTPVSSRYDGTPPPDATMYANDYVAINKYCDRVKIMAYDQGSIDVSLNKARAAPYVPVSDPAWVEKVITLAAEKISKKKLMIGIATYGYEYSVKPLSEYGYRYDRQWALNPKYATDLAKSLGITPVRNSSGELSFIYKDTSGSSSGAGDISTNTPQIDGNPIQSTVYSQVAIAASIQPPFNVVWWSDAKAIEDKVTLAQRLGVRGVAIFKIDGGEDVGLWDVLKKI